MAVQSGFNLKAFTAFLPWHGDPAYVPTDIPLATLGPLLTPQVTEPPP